MLQMARKKVINGIDLTSDKKFTLSDIVDLELKIMSQSKNNIKIRGGKKNYYLKTTYTLNEIPIKIIFEYTPETQTLMHKEWDKVHNKLLTKALEKQSLRNKNLLTH